MLKHVLLVAAGLLIAFGSMREVRADEPCMDFKWDVSSERRVFASEAVKLNSGKDADSAPAVEPNRLYRVALLPAAVLKFASPPGRTPEAGSNAGLIKLKVSTSGSYRVSLEYAIWVDVLDKGAPLSPYDYQAQRTCNAPHKIVVFDLVGPKDYVVQLVGTNADSVRVSVTSAPARVR